MLVTQNYEIKKPYWYRRDGNETTSHAEKMIAELEDATETLLFASGMSAATSVIDSLNPKCPCRNPKSHVSWRFKPISNI